METQKDDIITTLPDDENLMLPEGCGLIKYGSALVPFVNRFPKNTKLYELMTTKPGEGVFARGQAS